MCDVSVIIVSWNAKRYLLDCLGSIPHGLKHYAHELIVVDNQSSDGSPEAVQDQYPQVKLIRNKANLGFAKANNVGISSARGRYLCLVNSDVMVLPDCIDRLVDFMDHHPRTGMAGPMVLNTDGSLQHSHWEFPSVLTALKRTLALDTVQSKIHHLRPWPTAAHPEEQALDVEVLSGCFLLIRRAALDQVGLLDEDFFIYGEDVDLCRRFHEAKWKVNYLTAARAIHAGGASSANAPVRFFLEMQKANLHYWTKHHGPLGKGFYRCNTLVHHLLRVVPQLLIYLFRPSCRTTIKPKLERSTACIEWFLCSAKSRVRSVK